MLFLTSTLGLLLHLLLSIGLSVRVIMKRPAIGVALSWLLLIASVPGVGAVAYLMFGERRVGGGRMRAIDTLRTDYRKITQVAVRKGLTDVDWQKHDPVAKAMDRLGQTETGVPTVCGSELELFHDTEQILHAIAADIEQATTSVLMEFYIWNQGGAADEVFEALIRAAKRGVSCRVLVDHVGARPWWKSRQPQALLDAGVELRPALPVGIFRAFVERSDLRLHRKVVVIDGAIAWTGSMNLVDPRYFKQDAGVGEWVDAMVRLTGAAIVPLASTMIADWILESGEPLHHVISSAGLTLVEPRGPADIQVIPSGPGESGDGLLQMILALINAAREELVITTPYLVPDDSLLRALRGAAGRGVTVMLIIPEKVDSFLTRYASRSYYDDLLNSGIEIYFYQGGLLHTKSITADASLSMFGTVNIDMRSVWLNYEVSLFVYDQGFAIRLRALQQTYLDGSKPLDAIAWSRRSFGARLIENGLRLFSPLL